MGNDNCEMQEEHINLPKETPSMHVYMMAIYNKCSKE